MAKDLICKLLTTDPKSRYGGEEVMAHPWIKGEGTPRTKLPNMLNELKKFNAKRKFKKVASAVIAGVRLKKLTSQRKLLEAGTTR